MTSQVMKWCIPPGGLKRRLQQNRQLSWEEVDRQDWHLWILAVLLLFVLGISLLTFMFPTAFWFGRDLALSAPQRAFAGFCVLLALILVYLLQRQAAMRRLRRQLFEARAAVEEAERRASLQSFEALPAIGQFRDALAMEYRRAASMGAHLAVLVLAVPQASREEVGRIAVSLRYMLRRGEIMARLFDTTLAILLPGMQASDANAVGAQIEESVRASLPHLAPTADVTAYPQQAASLAELEASLRSSLA